MLDPKKYTLKRALRPFSYSVAIITCGLGVLLAYRDGLGDDLRAVAVMVAGILLQVAVNLLNNHSDQPLWEQASVSEHPQKAQVLATIRQHTLGGMVAAGIAVLIGLWLTWQVGWGILLLGAVGLVGGYGYTGEPINYKAKGLGVPCVFWLMGVLMVAGAYYAVAGDWSNSVMLEAIPVSVLSALLLLSNEIRDIDVDEQQGMQTLTVRWGLGRSLSLYYGLLLVCYVVSLLMWYWGKLLTVYWLFVPLLLLPGLLALLKKELKDRYMLPPKTGLFFLVFGLAYSLALY
ncbi:prenyltransferase [Zooshikella harenae]|uniref:Prenyltransferase n=1 Tax=Zooshikella harenae TaxID=2827238 RepID=A0ABS5ZAM3_9GAMM|nr:prenyltransferase [Zooshikella harenae]MBU2711044.1 prenyltransferase [Zooshikella harenae]